MSNRYNATNALAAAVAAGAVAFEFRNGSTRRCYIEEIGFTAGAATAGRFALARAGAQGAGGTTTTALPEDTANPAAPTATLLAAGFTTSPTVPAATSYMRRINTGASIGAGFIWQWGSSDRLLVPASGSLILVAIAASPAVADFYMTWSE